jgi:lipoate synthase
MSTYEQQILQKVKAMQTSIDKLSIAVDSLSKKVYALALPATLANIQQPQENREKLQIVSQPDQNGCETAKCPNCQKHTATGGKLMGGVCFYYCHNCDAAIHTDASHIIYTVVLK